LFGDESSRVNIGVPWSTCHGPAWLQPIWPLTVAEIAAHCD